MALHTLETMERQADLGRYDHDPLSVEALKLAMKATTKVSVPSVQPETPDRNWGLTDEQVKVGRRGVAFARGVLAGATSRNDSSINN